MKHIQRDFSLNAWVRACWVDLGGGAEVKIKLFQNMVMLHIKLKLTTLAATSHRTYDSAKTDGYGKNSCLPERVPFGG